MILCVGTTPAVQRVMVFPRLRLDAVNRAATTLDGAAGKAVNVAKVLKALGEHCLVAGFLGGERGGFVRATLHSLQIGTEFMEVPAQTRQCITVIDQSAGTVTELVEESQPVAQEYYDRLLEAIPPKSEGCQAMVLSGTITSGGPVDFYRRCAQVAKERGALAVVDGRGELLLESLQAGPDLIKPNRTELAGTLGIELTGETTLFSAMDQLRELGARQIVITAGKHPTLATDGRRRWRIHPPSIQPVNPIGSGDACTAGMVSRLVRGDDLGEACRWGAAAGAANALCLMPGDVTREGIECLAELVLVERA